MTIDWILEKLRGQIECSRDTVRAYYRGENRADMSFEAGMRTAFNMAIHIVKAAKPESKAEAA